MKSTIKKLWVGELFPFENLTRNDIEIKELVGMIAKHRKDIYNKLDDEARRALEQYDACISQIHTKELEKAFEKGFSLGTRLVAEGLCGD